MAEFRLSAGATVDLLTKQEVSDALREQADADADAMGRGVKWLDLSESINATAINVNGYVIPVTPNAGYVWNVRLWAVLTSAAQVTRLWKALDSGQAGLTAARPIIQVGSAALASAQFSSGQLLLRSGEYLFVTALGATNLLQWMVSVIETPEATLWKTLV